MSLVAASIIAPTAITHGSEPSNNSQQADHRTNPPSSTRQKQPRKRARITKDVKTEDFSVMESPHPYGILPGGNRFLDSLSRNDGPTCHLSDECWYLVLEFCDGTSLGRLLQTCRYFYAASSEPELWRDLVLIKQANKTLTRAGPSWKDAYVKLNNADENDSVCPPHVPMSVSGVYSDFFYRLHSCRSFSIPAAWLDTECDTLTRVPFGTMTIQMFEEQFERPNTPVVIEGAACSWKAFQRWKQPKYLLEQAANQSFRATSGAATLPGTFTLAAYYDYCRSTHLEEAPLYLFDRAALTPGSDLWNDYMGDLQKTCPYWDPERQDTSHDLFKVLGEGRRPDHTWLIMGARRSGSVFHIDPNATHAWNAVISGRKRWIFYPPGVTPPGVLPSEDGDEVALPLSIGEWLFQFWDEHVQRKRSAPPDEQPLECTALPGDVVFVPHGWWHMVINLDEINIAITHNYASGGNLPSVFKFLKDKREQVSGCRDRAESIKPECLYEEFVKALEKTHPELVKQALDDPDWACRAWTHMRVLDKDKQGSKPKGGTDAKPSVMARAGCGNDFSFSFM